MVTYQPYPGALGYLWRLISKSHSPTDTRGPLALTSGPLTPVDCCGNQGPTREVEVEASMFPPNLAGYTEHGHLGTTRIAATKLCLAHPKTTLHPYNYVRSGDALQPVLQHLDSSNHLRALSPEHPHVQRHPHRVSLRAQPETWAPEPRAAASPSPNHSTPNPAN